MPAEKPAEDFRARLQHSIYALGEERRRRRIPQGGSGTMPLVAMAAIVATVVLTPFLWEPEAVVDLPPIVVQGPVVRGVPVPPDARPAAVDPGLLLLSPNRSRSWTCGRGPTLFSTSTPPFTSGTENPVWYAPDFGR